MRIAFITNKFPAVSETFILDQLTGLAERGHEVHVFAGQLLPSPGKNPEIDEFYTRQRAHQLLERPSNKIARIGRGAKIFLHCLSKDPGLALNSVNFIRHGKKSLSLELLFLAASFAGHGRFDVIHANYGPNGVLALGLRKLLPHPPPIITTFYGYDLSRIVREEGAEYYRGLGQEGAALLPVSEFFAAKLGELGCAPAKIAVHRLGIKLKDFPFQERTRRPDRPAALLSVARLVEKKGLEYAIRAVARLKRDRPELSLAYSIVGEGPLREKLEGLIEQLEVSDRVKLLGARAHGEVPGLIAAADLFLLPSVTAGNGDEEGTPVSLMEAMAGGAPVVATRHAGIPEFVEDNLSGFLVPERDVEALAEKIAYLLDNPQRWPEMGRKGRRKIEANHDIRKLNERLEEIYRRAIQETPP